MRKFFNWLEEGNNIAPSIKPLFLIVGILLDRGIAEKEEPLMDKESLFIRSSLIAYMIVFLKEKGVTPVTIKSNNLIDIFSELRTQIKELKLVPLHF
jgi:hypothetical protein